MAEIEIEKGIELPGARGPKYPFASLEVGDSFFIPGKEVLAGLYDMGKKLGFKFTQRKVEGGLRIWRIA